jgi:hypothetical protein
MAHRSFTLALPADTNAHNLYDNLLLITGAIPTDGILPNRVMELEITAAVGNGANTVAISDRNTANTLGRPLVGTTRDSFLKRSARNSICLRDYVLKPSANSLTLYVDIESV